MLETLKLWGVIHPNSSANGLLHKNFLNGGRRKYMSEDLAI